MALLPTGSDKLLEIRTNKVNVVIKSKKKITVLPSNEARSSSLAINGYNIERVKIENQGIEELYQDTKGYSVQQLSVSPLFFEQTDYELIIKSRNNESVSFWNENYLLREKVGPVTDDDNSLVSGIINFGNEVGYSDFEINVDGRKHLVIRIEVYPTKISYKEDYQMMMADVSEMCYACAIDFMQKTYQEFQISDKQNTVPAIFFQIISAVFDKYINAARRIISVPHHKLITEHTVVPEHKARRTDKMSEKWLMKNQNNIAETATGFDVSKVLAVKKIITYDTNENRFVKFILRITIRKIEDFLNRYLNSSVVVEETIVIKANEMISSIRGALNTSFLREVSDFNTLPSMSLVFSMAPGYRELYKYYLMMHRGLAVNGDIFRISVKDTAQLYEYWCFIKLFSILKKEYKLISPDVIKVDNSGITVSLVKGRKSEVLFINPKTGEKIRLVYNPAESKTQTVNQKPDNVLELEKLGTEVSYKYVFDAKYRIENNPSNAFYPDENPGPKVDDINTMHRYRDSIVYENKLSKFTFEKTMFGAYILFPYADEELYKEHRFYKSIDTVNIGGLPFLPGATTLVQELLGDLISDSKESAFERTTLPRGIEEKLATVDWNKKDVLLGTFRDAQQFKVCFDKKMYYIPAKEVEDKDLPIHYVALYQTINKFGAEAGIRYYGEVLRTALVRRESIKEVPVRRNNGQELYYRFYIREWKELQKPICPREVGFTKNYTNLFLLEHSEYIPELLFQSEEEYRFYAELKRNVNSAEINDAGANIGFEHEDTKFVFAGGNILAIHRDEIVEQIPVADFSRKPAATFRKLQRATENKQSE